MEHKHRWNISFANEKGRGNWACGICGITMTEVKQEKRKAVLTLIGLILGGVIVLGTTIWVAYTVLLDIAIRSIIR